MKTKQNEETQSFTNADIECGNKYDFIMKNVSTAQSLGPKPIVRFLTRARRDIMIAVNFLFKYISIFMYF